MLLPESAKFNKGFPESLELPLPTPTPPPAPEFNLLSIEVLENNFWLLAGVLGFLLLFTAIYWLKRKKNRRQSTIAAQIKTKNFPYKNEISLMLTLAKQYNEAGYSDNALQLLNTVLAHGNEAEGDEAFQLITQIQKESASNADTVNHVF